MRFELTVAGETTAPFGGLCVSQLARGPGPHHLDAAPNLIDEREIICGSLSGSRGRIDCSSTATMPASAGKMNWTGPDGAAVKVHNGHDNEKGPLPRSRVRRSWPPDGRPPEREPPSAQPDLPVSSSLTSPVPFPPKLLPSLHGSRNPMVARLGGPLPPAAG